MSDQTNEYIIAPGSAKWIGLAFGLFTPILLALFFGVIYSGGAGGGADTVQVFPAPEE